MGHRVPLFFSAALSMHRRNESVLEGTLVRGVYALLSPSLLFLLTSSPFLVAWSVPYTPRFFSAPRHRNRISVTRRPWVVGMPLCPKVPFLPLPLLFPSGFPPRFKSPRWGSVRFSARVVGFLNAGFRWFSIRWISTWKVHSIYGNLRLRRKLPEFHLHFCNS